MPRSPSSWWPWVQRNLDANGWSNADLARAIRAEVGAGPDESVIGRWRTRDTQPKRESVIATAAAFHRPAKEALIAAGHVKPQELDTPWTDPATVDLTIVPDEVLADEVRARLTRKRPTPAVAEKPRKRQRQSAAANGTAANGTALSVAKAGGTRHSIAVGPPAETEPETETAPPPDEGEGAEVTNSGHNNDG